MSALYFAAGVILGFPLGVGLAYLYIAYRTAKDQ